MIKRNTLIIIYIKTQTQFYLSKHFSIDIIRKIFYCRSKWTMSQQGRVSRGLSETGGVVVGGGEFPLSSSSSSRMGFSAESHISKSSNAVSEKGVSMPGLKLCPNPVDHFPSRIEHRPDQQTPDTRLCPKFLVHLRLKVLRPSFRVFLAVWGMNGTRARWLFNKCCL